MGKRSYRAWGGILEEEHQELLLAIIAKSGALIADVTEPNANVTLEIGYAVGRRMPVYLLAEENRWSPTANIPHDWVFTYEAGEDESGWELEVAEKAGLYFTMVTPLRIASAPFPAWRFKPHLILATLAEAMGFDDEQEN